MDEPDPIARTDQACAGFAEAAKMHAAYFKTLVAEGFQRSEAMELTLAYIESLSVESND